MALKVKVPTKRLRNAKEAALHLGVSAYFLGNRRKRGQPPDFVRLGDRVLYTDEALDEFIKLSTVKSGGQAA
jgi:hypothetical protein